MWKNVYALVDWVTSEQSVFCENFDTSYTFYLFDLRIEYEEMWEYENKNQKSFNTIAGTGDILNVIQMDVWPKENCFFFA